MLINSIEKAKSLDFIDKVFVSTDDDQFGSLAKKNGAIYLSRTKELSDDFIGVGEKAEDLIPFDQESYIKGLISEKETVEA